MKNLAWKWLIDFIEKWVQRAEFIHSVLITHLLFLYLGILWWYTLLSVKIVVCSHICIILHFVLYMKRSFTLSVSVIFVMAHFVLFVHVFSILFWSVLVFSYVLFVMRHELCFCLECNIIYLSLMFLLRLIRCLNGLMFLFGLC